MSHSISDAVLKNRVSKAHFLDAVLAREVTIGELTVIAVGRFIPGSQVTNTSAYVLTYRDTTSEDKVYCTHLLICPEPPAPWVLTTGHYDLTWDEAVADLATR